MVKIAYEPKNQRAAVYDDDAEIGESTYVVTEEGHWVINHTFVEPSYGGQGIATKLVAQLVEEARAQDKKIIPLCPFAAREFEKKREYHDVLPQG